MFSYYCLDVFILYKYNKIQYAVDNLKDTFAIICNISINEFININRIENIVAKGKNAPYNQFFLLQCFQKLSATNGFASGTELTLSLM